MKNRWNILLLLVGIVLGASPLSGLGSVTAMGEALRLSLEEEARALRLTTILPASFEELAACKELSQEMTYGLFGEDYQKRLEALKDFAFWWLRGGALIARDQAERVVGVVLAARYAKMLGLSAAGSAEAVGGCGSAVAPSSLRG